jgi:hypothetical protein
METGVLISEAVASEMNAHFIESRLHTDLTKDKPEMAAIFLELQNELTNSFAAPTYVVYDPVGERVLGIEKGVKNVFTAAGFTKFLRDSRAKL